MVWVVTCHDSISDREKNLRVADEIHSTLPGESGLSVTTSQSKSCPEEGVGGSVAFLS